MRIKSIELNNIRSYLNERIDFPHGAVLLSGDIGAGKSTILQAIEFALFGFLKGTLSGSSLLRNGKNKGHVSLTFEIDGKEFTIKRTLKRERNTVSQDSGSIIIDNTKYDLTPLELKAKVLEILGYPQEFLTKSKSLIYRYTVYTPQEEMKRILFEEKELRVDTLRRLFQIEKYRRIVENSEIIVKKINELKKEYSGFVFDLGDRLKQKDDLEKERDKIKKKIEEIIPLFNVTKEKVLKKKEEVRIIEEEIKKLNELKRMSSILKERIVITQKECEDKLDELNMLEKEVRNIEEELNKITINRLDKNREEIEKEIKDVEEMIYHINHKIGETEYIKKTATETKNTIATLKTCPVCLQEVQEDHKREVISKEERKLGEANHKLALLLKEKSELNSRLELLKNEIRKIATNETLLEKKELLEKERKNRMLKKEEKIKQIDNLKASIENFKKEFSSVENKMLSLKNKEEKILETKRELDALLEEERAIELRKISLEKEMEGLEKQLIYIISEINKKEEVAKKIEKLEKIKDWIENMFVEFVKLTEKHIMYRIYIEFNELFRKWATMLIEDENLTVSLDEDFTPIIEQNGYQTEIYDLSGGEKTACALAYRLALNRVVSDVVSSIKTKDIIILDEPTDGFSSEQLDKVRDVLEQLNTSQTIIVSHEEKMESFVDHIIRISKVGHVSKVIT